MIKAKIIYVDNSEFMHGLMKKKLNAFNLDVVCVYSIADVEKAVTEGRYDMIVSGMEILGGTAVDLIEYLKRMDIYTVPLVVLSSISDPDTKQRVLEAGAMDFVNKTTGLNELIDSINSFFNMSGPLCRMLTVDDSLTVRKITKTILEKNKLEAVEAKNGAMALGMFEKNHFCAVLSDVNMPIMNGTELYKSIRQKSADIPFFFMTTDSDSELIRKLIEGDNFADFVLKPFTEESIMSKFNIMRDKKQHKH